MNKEVNRSRGKKGISRQNKSRSIQDKRRSRRKKGILKVVLLGVIGLAIIGFGIIRSDVFGMTNEDINNDTPKKVEELVNPTELLPGHNLSYEGYDNAVDAELVEKMMSGKVKSDKKYVFLTFDDGPSPNTKKVLDILKNKGVHGTFFVLGQRVDGGDQEKELVKRMVKEGHAIANHTYTHNFNKLYPGNTINLNYFMSEVEKTNNALKSVLGESFNTRVLRLPGGYNSREFYKDPGLKSFDDRLSNDGIISIDWNALNGDAEGKPYTIEEMMKNVIKSTGNQNQVVILMHDTFGKEKTAQMLPEIIDFYKGQGYEFKTII